MADSRSQSAHDLQENGYNQAKTPQTWHYISGEIAARPQQYQSLTTKHAPQL
jgi:hypothetical protein